MSRLAPDPRSRAARFGRALIGLSLAFGVSCTPSRPYRPALVAPDRVAGTSVDAPDVATAVVAAHNAERARKRLPALALNPELTVAAQAHADEMARRGRMSHRGASGSSPFDRIERAGYSFRAAAENVAAGYEGVDAVMAGWMRSPGHRRNILGATTEIGVGRALASSGTSYWCVTFGTPRVAVSPRGLKPSAMLREVATRGTRADRGG